MPLRIEKIVYPGKSLGREGGKVVLTDEGLPGELVEIAVLKDKKNFVEAGTISILERSAARIEPRCAHYRTCSSYQCIEYATQLEIKKAQLEEILGHGLKRGATEPAVEIAASPRIWGYRNKIRLRLLKKDDGFQLAYHQPASLHRFAEVDSCFLVPEDTNALLAAVRETAKPGAWEDVEEIEIKRSTLTGEMLIILHAVTGTRLSEIGTVLGELRGRFRIIGAVGSVPTEKGIKEARLWGRNFIEDKAAGAFFFIGPRSFFQVNAGLLESVLGDIRAFLELSGQETIADLFCGIGTLGLALAPRAREVYGVESEAASVVDLKRNIQRNKAGNFSVCEGSSAEWIEELLDRGMDAVILDPPRRGLEPGLIEHLLKKPVPRIAYLSCNPTTLARDLGRLLSGYNIESVRGYDFFPHTPHIETLAFLRRAKRGG